LVLASILAPEMPSIVVSILTSVRASELCSFQFASRVQRLDVVAEARYSAYTQAYSGDFFFYRRTA